jgi:hypothetical protein
MVYPNPAVTHPCAGSLVRPLFCGRNGPRTVDDRRLQSRQLPAHAGDAGADQRLVADEPEGQADQDRREGREPRPRRRLPDGRGRHPPANVPGDFAADCRAAAEAAARASVRRSMVVLPATTDERGAHGCQKQSPIRLLGHISSCPRD